MNTQLSQTELEQLHELLMPVLARAAVGEFDSELAIDANRSRRFNEIVMGVEVLLEVIREKMAEEAAQPSASRDTQDKSMGLFDEVLKAPNQK